MYSSFFFSISSSFRLVSDFVRSSFSYWLYSWRLLSSSLIMSFYFFILSFCSSRCSLNISVYLSWLFRFIRADCNNSFSSINYSSFSLTFPISFLRLNNSSASSPNLLPVLSLCFDQSSFYSSNLCWTIFIFSSYSFSLLFVTLIYLIS